MDITEATTAYETWLAKQIPLIDADLRSKHDKMAENAFPFLRATFYRWVQLWAQFCSKLADAPLVLGIGDLHVENFGTWRDAEGRLVWGVNDFDEAAVMPYTNDLVRLAVSAALAPDEKKLSTGLADACEAILTGYREGFEKTSAPFVLAERHAWLGGWALKKPVDAVAFWQELDLPDVSAQVPPGLMLILKSALPEPDLPFRVVHRQAGLGSRGRRRFGAVADWRGGKVAREAKELAVSAWHWETEKNASAEIVLQTAIDRAVRVPDPFAAVRDHWLLRRLAPDCRRLDLRKHPQPKDEGKLLEAMGRETAHVHLGTKGAAGAILKDLDARPGKWLQKAVENMAEATRDDWKTWKAFWKK